jgi:Icc protein
MAIEILQFTDLHLPPSPGERIWGIDPMARLRRALAHARRHHPEARLALFTGDLVHEPDAGAYARLDTLLAGMPWPCWSLPGNHDDPRRMQAALPHAPRVERGAVGRWRVHLLDSTMPGQSAGRLDAATLARLRRYLQGEPEAPALVCLHHHARPVGSPWLDAIMLENAAELEGALEDGPARLVLWGHTHQEFAGRIGRVPALGAPSTAMQFRPRSREFAIRDLGPGYRWVRLHEDGRFETGVRYLGNAS